MSLPVAKTLFYFTFGQVSFPSIFECQCSKAQDHRFWPSRAYFTSKAFKRKADLGEKGGQEPFSFIEKRAKIPA